MKQKKIITGLMIAIIIMTAIILLNSFFIESVWAHGPNNWERGNWWGRGPGWYYHQPGMMGPPSGGMGHSMMGWHHGWGMWRSPWGNGNFGQQPAPSPENGYTPPSLPNNSNNTPKSHDNVSFQADVQPIFNTRCTSCHGGIAALFLNNYTNVMRGGINGPVIIPGDPENSRLIQYVRTGYMPYGGPPLTPAQIETLINWVAAGAPNN